MAKKVVAEIRLRIPSTNHSPQSKTLWHMQTSTILILQAQLISTFLCKSSRSSSKGKFTSEILPLQHSTNAHLRSKRTDIPIYSFAQHQRQKETMSIYSPHVVILEGILALNDPRILEMLDMKVYVEADADLCLSRRSKRCF
jgi:Phosphoribulokinase / Uridine kinase family